MLCNSFRKLEIISLPVKPRTKGMAGDLLEKSNCRENKSITNGKVWEMRLRQSQEIL